MRTLVTGGAGYVGSHLADALIDRGDEVLVVDNLSTGKMANVEHLLGHERFHFVHGTIVDRALMDRLVAQVDQVYHLAAVVGVKYVIDDPVECIRTNVLGSEIVLEAAHRFGRRIVVVSSSEVYGKNGSVPLAEDDDCLLGSTKATRWSYALAKALDEHLALGYFRQGLPVSVVRYFNSYGPRLDARGYGSVVARFVMQAMLGQPLSVFGDGQQTRCFTYVDDTVRGTILAATRPEAVGQVFNLGSDREIRIVDLAETIRNLVGSDSQIVHIPYDRAYGDSFEETRRRVPDTSRAAEMLGFRAYVSLEDGLQETIAWFRETGAHLNL
jgi:UDP-glucose 4-epimerase